MSSCILRSPMSLLSPTAFRGFQGNAFQNCPVNLARRERSGARPRTAQGFTGWCPLSVGAAIVPRCPVIARRGQKAGVTGGN
jgi:hypothetical protein